MIVKLLYSLQKEMRKKEKKSEGKYWEDKYWELDREYHKRDELHREVNENLQVELSGKNARIEELKKDIEEYKVVVASQNDSYEDLLNKYNFVLKKLSNNPAIIKQTDEMIKFYNHMMSHERVVGPVLGLMAGVIISLLCFYLF